MVSIALAIYSGPISPGDLESLLMPGKVIQGHADIEGNCRKCHIPFKKNEQPKLCLDCHKDIAADVATRSGYHGRLERKRPCNDCHTEHKGRRADIVALEEATFDHTLTDYVLLGLHTKVKCEACHRAGKKYREAPKACVACHRKDDVHKGKLGVDCGNCHSAAGWKKGTFDHSRTRFPLRGSHGPVPCRACHKSATFHDKPSRICGDCHQSDDVHKGRFGKRCENCHSETKWNVVRFDHERETGFALREAHRAARCIACHTTPLKKKRKLPTTCIGCHKKDDVHKGRYGANCKNCHSEVRWKKLVFDHDRQTNFPLRHSHQSARCDACHGPQLQNKTPPTNCRGCHTKDDVHRGALGPECGACHMEAKWNKTRFDHSKHTKYPLLGKHAKVRCSGCHADNTFRKKPKTDCIACHQRDDVHAGQQGRRCEQCHTESSWKTAQFDHSKSRFPLVGRHLNVQCNECHATKRFMDAPIACIGCHRGDDAHKGKLGATCDLCHNARDWRIWDFDHHKQTGFVIDGAHENLTCTSCHTRPGKVVYTAGARCIDCHDRDDVHRGGFGRECSRCHLTTTFQELRTGVKVRAR
ncbi:MAG: cytochrome C [Betaproteobacteria bacterium]|nr:MAG: cytochrome C [Betaproteobacteria bacterium]